MPNRRQDWPTSNCGHCHECGRPLKKCLDGEEWCSRCGTYCRYRSHGWDLLYDPGGSQECPDQQSLTVRYAQSCLERSTHAHQNALYLPKR